VALGCVAVAAALLALWGAAAHQGSAAALLARKGELRAVETTPRGQDAVSTIEELTLRSSTAEEIHALVRVPKAGGSRLPAAVLMGGIKRGRRIATAPGLEAIARLAVVVSADYPLKLDRHAFEGLAALGTVTRLRPAALDSVVDVMLLLDYLERRPDVDASRLFLVGGSLGAPVVAVAGAVDPRPAAVIVLYGGGELGPLIAHTLEHPAQGRPYPHWAAWLGGHGLAWLLTPLEPARYAPLIAPRRFLMVNGRGDSLIPAANVAALYEAAQDPKELIWMEGDHIQPEETALVGQVSGTVAAWLHARGLLPDEPGAASGRGARP
jgi:dienelactone hydrolase